MLTSPSSFQRILVTGGTGFIGRHLVRRLITEGASIRLFVRSPQKASELFPEVSNFKEGSLEHKSQVLDAMQDCDGVIHLGGLYRFGRRYRHELHQTNVIGTQNVIHAAKVTGVQKLLSLSTAGVLKSTHPLITENDFPTSPPWGTPYKLSKWQAESSLLQAIQEGLPACIASPTCPLGEEDSTPTPTGKVILDFLKDEFPFYTHTGINIIDIHDLTEGLYRSFFNGEIGSRSLLSARNLWLKELLNELYLLTGIDAPRHSIPSSFLFAGALASEAIPPFLNPQGRLNLETAIQSRRIQFYNAEQTYRSLNWRPSMDCTDALQRAIDWYQANLLPADHRFKNLPKPLLGLPS
jgi:dihydroflavonol-4-reductase